MSRDTPEEMLHSAAPELGVHRGLFGALSLGGLPRQGVRAGTDAVRVEARQLPDCLVGLGAVPAATTVMRLLHSQPALGGVNSVEARQLPDDREAMDLGSVTATVTS